MKKIRIGNDFSFAWAIERNGLQEDLSGALNMTLRLRNSLGAIQTITDYTVTGNVVSVDVTPAMAKTLGKYVFILTYELPDAGLTDLERMCEVDTDAFVIVPRTAEADDSKDLLVASDMAIGFRGKDAYEVWLETHEGTLADYEAFIKGDTGKYGETKFVINDNMELEQHTLIGDPLNFAIVDDELVLNEAGQTVNLGTVGIVPKGEWSNLETYSKLDLVTSTEGSHLSLIDGNTSAVDTADWLLLAKNGIDGYGAVLQELGNSETLVMSQKVVTELLDMKPNIIPGKNLFDINSPDNQLGKYLNETNGGIEDSINYNTSHFISVEPNTQYSHKAIRNHGYYTARDYNTLIVGSGGEYQDTSTSPATAKYFAFSAYITGTEASAGMVVTWNNTQVEKGNTPTSYEPYTKMIDPSLIADVPNKALSRAIAENEILVKKDDLYTQNIYDGTVPIGNTSKYVNGYFGTLDDNVNYDSTDYIAVTAGRLLQKKNTLQHWAFYDVNKMFVSGGETGSVQEVNKVIAPVDGYFRYSFYKGNAHEEYLITTHETVTTIPQFGEIFIKPSLIDVNRLELSLQSDIIEVILPPEIVVAVGRTIEIYNEQIAICGNINNFHFRWICDIGKALKRKFSVTGYTQMTKTLTLEVYSNNGVLLLTKTTSIKVVSVLASARTILSIGDSIANGKSWYSELRSLSNNNISFVGTRGTTPIKHEGRSGWIASNYLTASSYTYESEGIHPFWNSVNSRFDWAYYKTSTGINPDGIMLNLGTNQLWGITAAASDLKTIVDYIRQDDDTIPIYIVLIHQWGNQNALGGQTSVDGFQSLNGYLDLDIKTKILKLNKSYMAQFTNYTNLYYIPLYATMDREYNYGLTDTPVNPRQTLTEKMPIDSVHPQDSGYYQFADTMLGIIV